MSQVGSDSFEYFRKNTAVNVAVLANIAKAPAKPEKVAMDVKELTNFTVIRWEKPLTGTVAGYYVLMRDTDSSVWQKKFFTQENTIKLPYSKDNYFFAVQSVNNSGNASIPVITEVAR